MKVCFFNSNRSWGGGERWHLDLACKLREKGYEVLVIAGRESELHSRAGSMGLRRYGLNISNLSFLNPVKLLITVDILRKERVQGIILNLPSDLKAAGLAARLAGVGRIIYRRGIALPVRNTPLNRFLYRNVVTEVIANSLETKRMILKNGNDLLSEDRITVVYNGIDLAEYDGRDAPPLYERKGAEVVLGSAGRLTKQKNQRLLIEMARGLQTKGVEFKLLIAGSGELERALKSHAMRLGVAGRVAFLGFVDNIKSFMESIDIFLLPSRWEGFGYVLIEAMASGKPVVASRASSNPELVRDGESGLLAGIEGPDAFQRKTEELINDIELRRRLGSNGRRAVETSFDIAGTVEGVERILGGGY